MIHPADVRLISRIGQHLEGTGHFLSHYLEMVVVMLLGMLMLGIPLRTLLLSGYEDPMMDAPVPAYTLATLSMMVPMVAWMRYRGATWRRAAEMSAAMILAVAAPLALVELAATGGLSRPTRDSLPPMTHFGLFSMVALMLYHCKEYCQVPTGHEHRTALFSRMLSARRRQTAGNERDAVARLGVWWTLLRLSLVLALVIWGTLAAGAYH